MNYGRFFRLNQALSKVVDGVAIYDYTDLPAYFGPSMDNPMSPKYPISVTITSDSVCFRLHYSAYKIEKKTDDNNDEQGSPHYAYSKEDIEDKAFPKKDERNPNIMGTAHMEEVVLELPYTDNVSTILSDTIKEIYNTRFPLQEKEVEKQISYGGRFIEQLIRKRYPGYIRPNEKVKRLSLEEQLYHNLQIVSDNTASYSSLWLMDLKNNSGDATYLYDRNNKNTVIGFLRKLLLDFMFDLKHSDVFQNSENYQKMYSGLMSDFFFSALMHKCDYYYYRKLIRETIDQVGMADKNRITQLYAKKIIEAEKLWIDDIMSAQAEKHFEHHHRAIRWYNEILGHYSFSCWPSWFAEPEEEMRRVCFSMIEKNNKKKNKHICNAESLVECLGLERQTPNSRLAVKMVKSRDDSFERISRWFLKRYDFNDVLHLHIAKHFNIFLFSIVVVLLFWLFGAKVLFDSILDKINGNHTLKTASTIVLLSITCLIFISEYWKHALEKESPHALIIREVLQKNIWMVVLIPIIFIFMYYGDLFLLSVHLTENVLDRFIEIVGLKLLSLIAFFVFLILLLCYGLRGIYVFRFKNSRLEKSRTNIAVKKTIGPLFIIALFLCAYFYYPVLGKSVVIPVLIGFFVILYYNQWFGIMPTIHPISSLHLLFPRLVAAITAAWLTMSMGFDIYVSFFDQLPAWYTALAISAIVYIFIMYEINRIMPSCSAIRKLFRSFEFLVISYCISLLVGLVVINFVGEKYLERGGTLDEFYEQYVNTPQYGGLKGDSNYIYPPAAVDINTLKNDSEKLQFIVERVNIKEINDYSRKQVDSLRHIYHFLKDESMGQQKARQYPVVEWQPLFKGEIRLFIMRDFLIMFSFIAMFWGIFIQMIFTGEKQMTEL